MAKQTKVKEHIIERRAEVAALLEVAIKFKRKFKIAALKETLKGLDKLLEITE